MVEGSSGSCAGEVLHALQTYSAWSASFSATHTVCHGTGVVLALVQYWLPVSEAKRGLIHHQGG